MVGWIKIDRSIAEHWLWKDREPFDKRSAWIDLLLMANHKDFKAEHKGRIVWRHSGEVNVSTRYLAEKWRWSRGKVNRFLTLLESDSMVTLNSTTDGTTIIIENWGKWQNLQAANDTTDSTTDSTSDDTTGSTTGSTNDKNVKNISTTTSTNRGRPKSVDEVRAYVAEKGLSVDADYFFDYYEENEWKDVKGAPVKSWKLKAQTWSKREQKNGNVNRMGINADSKPASKNARSDTGDGDSREAGSQSWFIPPMETAL